MIAAHVRNNSKIYLNNNMRRPNVPLSLFFLTIISSLTTISQSFKYRSLYGHEDDRQSSSQSRAKLSHELLQFMHDSHEFQSKQLPDLTPNHNDEYDFIIVGAGSAGAVIASRLSEISKVTVLLIEAGDTENLLMDVPALASYLQYSNDVNWKYRTESSNTHCLGMTGRRCKWPRGKVMGGSSSLNFMIASRGTRPDYDQWQVGGWSYDQLLPYFKKLENMKIAKLRKDRRSHNTNGPVDIEYPPYHTPIADAFIRSGRSMGYPVIDYNGDDAQMIGFSYVQSTMNNGRRVSSNRAYLQPANGRNNLFVTRRSHANRVLIDEKTKKAYAVQFTKFGSERVVGARKEIILCAGTIGSAQLLMLSGVGPSDHLREMKINVLQDLPVGRNLMDHVDYEGLVFTVDQPVTMKIQDLIDPFKPYITDFLEKNYGPLTIPGGCEALAFIDVDNPKKLDAWPNVEFLFISSSMAADRSFRYNAGVSDQYWNRYFFSHSRNYSYTIFPILLRPKSRGRILLRSKNPKVHPRIFANYLDDPDDVRVMIKGIRMAIEMSKMIPMQRFNTRMMELSVPGCENFLYDSDAYWECALRTFTSTLYHPTGTCKMAEMEDETGVVDPKLRVKGIQGLRVADASIMPKIVSGHTNLPVMMIAEKLADMIKDDWKLDCR